MTLVDRLLSDEKKSQLIEDSIHLIEAEVAAAKGFTGVAVKTIFKLVVALKENLLQEALDSLLPSFVSALEPFYQSFRETGELNFQTYLVSKTDEVVNALVEVTDQRAAKAKNQVLKSGYEKLRGSAEKQVKAALPQIAGLLHSHLPQQS